MCKQLRPRLAARAGDHQRTKNATVVVGILAFVLARADGEATYLHLEAPPADP
jgi:hypothetical protein